LREACAGDEALCAEVAALLARHEGNAGFLETSALRVEARALARDLEHGAAESAGAEAVPAGRKQRHRAAWWLWLFAAAFTLDCLLRVWCQVLGPETLGFRTRTEGSRQIVAALRSGSPAEQAGLRSGDRLLAIDGVPIGAAFDRRVLTANLETGHAYVLGIEREGRRFETTATIGRTGFLDTAESRQHALWQLNALLLLATALFIAFSRPHDSSARWGALALATLSVGLYFVLVPPGYAAMWRALPPGTGALLWIPNLCVYLVGPIVLTFFTVFPRRLFRARWPYALIWLPALWFAPIFARSTYLTVYRPLEAHGQLVPMAVTVTGMSLFGLYGLASVAALATSYFRLRSPNERRRLRVLMVGGAIGVLPSLLRFLVWDPRSQSTVSRLLFTPAADYLMALLFMLFPACFAYSILRHRLFDIRVIVRQGLQYAAARGALLGMVPILGLILVADLLLHGDQPLIAIVEARGWVYVTLALAAGIAHSQRRRWGEAIDRRFFREQYDVRRLLHGVAADILQARGFADAAPNVVTRIESALHPEFVTVMQRHPDETVFLPVDSSCMGGCPPPLLAASRLIEMLRHSGAPLEVEKGGSTRLARRLPDHEVEYLSRAGIDLMVPIAMAPDQEEALLVLGARRSGQPYSREDRELLAAIAANLAVLLERPQPPAVQATGEFAECPQCGRCHDLGTERCTMDDAGLQPVHMSRTLAGRYLLERCLGRGGMGTVYEATDQALQRRVAVKVIREDRLDSTEVAQRFRQEARAVASVADPHVVTVYDYGVEAGRRAFLVMELLDGRSLRDEITRCGRLDAARTLQVFRGACAAVEAAHRRQLIHRDLKPENIFLARIDSRHGEGIKILDFGIAKFLSSCDEGPESGATADTSLGIVVGTPNYMSPEQLLGDRPDVFSDLWALTVVAYECLTGALPFAAATRDQWRQAVLAGRCTPLSEHLAHPPTAWQSFFDSGLAIDRGRRPRSAVELFRLLEQALED
jgi:tRNA A-37 threonylcarbamoyl transferase component Bud32